MCRLEHWVSVGESSLQAATGGYMWRASIDIRCGLRLGAVGGVGSCSFDDRFHAAITDMTGRNVRMTSIGDKEPRHVG